MLFPWLKLLPNMRHIGAFERFSVLGALILMSACSVLDTDHRLVLDIPVPDVSWQTEAEYCHVPVLTNPVILESLSQQLPEACEWLPTFDLGARALQAFCRDSTLCERLYISNARALTIPIIAKNAKYTDIALAQQKVLEITKQYSALTVNTFGDIDNLVKRGLQAFESISLNPFSKAILAAADSDLVSGVWQTDGDLLVAVRRGNTYVSVDERSSVDLSASFEDINCEKGSTTRIVLGVAPEQVKQLNFVSHIDHDSSEGSAYIVKHWLDLSGHLKRRTIAVDIKAACSTVTDSQFDEAHASAYFLVIKNTAASAPIWYLPPRG